MVLPSIICLALLLKVQQDDMVLTDAATGTTMMLKAKAFMQVLLWPKRYRWMRLREFSSSSVLKDGITMYSAQGAGSLFRCSRGWQGHHFLAVRQSNWAAMFTCEVPN